MTRDRKIGTVRNLKDFPELRRIDLDVSHYVTVMTRKNQKNQHHLMFLMSIVSMSILCPFEWFLLRISNRDTFEHSCLGILAIHSTICCFSHNDGTYVHLDFVRCPHQLPLASLSRPNRKGPSIRGHWTFFPLQVVPELFLVYFD